MRASDLTHLKKTFIVHASKRFAVHAAKKISSLAVSMPTETERRFESLSSRRLPLTRRWEVAKENENRNEYSAFVRRAALYGCRIVVVVVVTGKRGHRVYASRDDVAEEPRMSQFRVAGVVAPDHRQPVLHRVHRRLCTSVAERGRRRSKGRRRGGGVSISRSRAHPGIPGLSLFSPLDVWTARVRRDASRKMKIKCRYVRLKWRSIVANFEILILSYLE